MDTQVKYTADVYGMAAWADANRKRLIGIAVVVVVVGAMIGIYAMHNSSRQSEADAAIDRIKISLSGPATAAEATPYMQVADNFSDSPAGARALLMAGGILFEAGKYAEARATYEKFLASYRDYPLVNLALVGEAASFEAEGKIPEATARYEEILRHPQDSLVVQVKTALGRLYGQQNKPEQALRQYEELSRMTSAADSWTMQARVQLQDLLEKHPELKQKLAAEQAAATGLGAPTAPK